MEIFVFKNVSFSYPEQHKKALNDLSFKIKKGSFNIICGASGCGKSTLLRHFKTCLAPHGVFTGDIFFNGTVLSETDTKTQASSIGFVLQSPENQVVTDKVWHELAFGLESLGCDTQTIRRRTAEMASFFGIENWFYKDVTELSGGQKQLLSLASVMVMQPDILILDEPTSQLDPIAAGEFLSVLSKINRELGTTIVLTEHRLEEAFPFADNVLVLENGGLLCEGTPQEVGDYLRTSKHSMFLAMPTAMRVWSAIPSSLPCPVTIRDGNDFLTELSSLRAPTPPTDKASKNTDSEYAVSAKELRFRYEKNSPDILNAFSISIKRGEFYALLGGNGTGKTTALKVLSGIENAYSGDISKSGSIALLAQNPQSLFVKKTVYEDLRHALSTQKLSDEEVEKEIDRVVKLCHLEDFLHRHPYDISGGEQQRSALAKILLTKPDILFLDEPTKGFDARFKVLFAEILYDLLSLGVTVLMVSHDIVFCSEYADRCGLFFDGHIVAEGTPTEFFSGNSFYTTPANRMARHILPDAVTATYIIEAFGGKAVKAEKTKLQHRSIAVPVHKKEEPQKLPLWRKITAFVCAVAALCVFIYAVSITDLSSTIGADGILNTSSTTFYMYGILILALSGVLASVGRRSKPPITESTPKEKRKITKRTALAAFMILLMIPLTIFIGVFYLDNKHWNIIALLVLFECMLPFLLVFEGRKPKARELVTIAVLCAIGVASRAVFFMLPQFKPVLALTVLTGVALGAESGFLVGAVTMLASNVFFSQGPWTPWQMFAMGIIGFLAGLLFKKGLLGRGRVSLSIFGAFSAVIIYGGLMNLSSAVMWNAASLNGSMILAYFVSGFPMDLIHAAATVIFIMFAANPMLEKLDRIKTKYGLLE